MLTQYLKIGLRNIWKNRGFSLINLIGLSLGLASMMVLVLLVHQYYTTDGFHADKERLYYLKTYTPDGNSYQQTVFPLLYEIQKSCPEVVAATHLQSWDDPWLKSGDVEVQEKTRYVDSGFFQVFSFPLLEGNAAQAMTDKHSVVISKKVARQLFGNEKALGKTISASDTILLTVTGVLDDIPGNSSLSAEVLLNLQLLLANPEIAAAANWYNTFAENFLRIEAGADPKLLDQKIDRIVKQFYDPDAGEQSVKTVPFSQLKKEGSPVMGSIVMAAMASAIFIVLVLLANLLNLNTAIAFSRTKEVAIRRMIGSGRLSVVLQFCLENALIVMAALLVALLLFKQILLPLTNDLMGDGFGELQFHWQQEGGLLLLYIGVAAIIALVAGSVPAWYVSSVKVSEAVKGKVLKADTKFGLRQVFITLQFALAVLLIGAAFILNSQLRYMKAASLGFNPQDVAVVKLDMAFKDPKQASARFETILQGLRTNPAVASLSTSPVIPTAYWNDFNTYIDLESGKEVHLRQVPADAGLIETYQIPILQGRNFNDLHPLADSSSVMLNKKAAVAFGWSDPIGKQIKSKGSDEVITVVGVMDDFHYNDLQQPIEPLLHWYRGKLALGNSRYLSLRLDPNAGRQLLSQLEQSFKSMPSRRSFSYTYMDELVENQYALMDGLMKVTNYVALLTILIAAMGLFGLVALFARQRVKEIGIRKVLGASVLNIVTLLSKDFLKLVVLAILIASPIAWWVMQQWLQDFAYRISISWWIFAGAGLMALLIALVTVSVQAIKAATANPINSLRSE